MWETLGAAGSEYRLTIRATRVSMRQLAAIIVGCVIAGGGAAMALMITFSTETGITLVRSAVIATSGGLAVVMTLTLLWAFSWRRKRYGVTWNDAGVRIDGARRELDFPWASLARVLIRTDTDYARIELRRTDGTSATLLAGFGSQDVKKPDAIDRIPDGVIDLLRRNLYVELPPERKSPGLHIFLPPARP